MLKKIKKQKPVYIPVLLKIYFSYIWGKKTEMANNLFVSCIQADLYWEDTDKNLSQFEKQFKNLPTNSEIIILPEMFTTGFSMNSDKLAEEMNGKTFQWMKKQAHDTNKTILGSIIIKENKKYYNRLMVMFPNGEYHTYDKGHLFRMEKENESFTKGTEKLVFKHNDWRICPMICYDLRFPVWSRNRNDYDLLIYVANWPEARAHIWKSLLIARAIENQSYVIGVNRVGKDGEDLTYSGDTVIINPKGQLIKSAERYKEEVINAELSLIELNEFREKFPVFLDADDFKIL